MALPRPQPLATPSGQGAAAEKQIHPERDGPRATGRAETGSSDKSTFSKCWPRVPSDHRTQGPLPGAWAVRPICWAPHRTARSRDPDLLRARGRSQTSLGHTSGAPVTARVPIPHPGTQGSQGLGRNGDKVPPDRLTYEGWMSGKDRGRGQQKERGTWD